MFKTQNNNNNLGVNFCDCDRYNFKHSLVLCNNTKITQPNLMGGNSINNNDDGNKVAGDIDIRTDALNKENLEEHLYPIAETNSVFSQLDDSDDNEETIVEDNNGNNQTGGSGSNIDYMTDFVGKSFYEMQYKILKGEYKQFKNNI